MIIYNEWLMCQIYSLGIAVYSVSAEERNGLQVNVISDLFGNFLSLISSIQIKDIVDIAVVAIMFYYVFKFLRDRRAGKLAFGVVFLFAASGDKQFVWLCCVKLFDEKCISNRPDCACYSVSAGTAQRA